MTVMIRLSRGGRKKRPFYTIVAVDRRKKRDGKFLDKIGFYNPSSKNLVVKKELLDKWQNFGAQLSDRVSYLLKKKETPPKVKETPPKVKEEAKKE
jgi:small subunit ribosomal protein S16